MGKSVEEGRVVCCGVVWCVLCKILNILSSVGCLLVCFGLAVSFVVVRCVNWFVSKLGSKLDPKTAQTRPPEPVQ